MPTSPDDIGSIRAIGCDALRALSRRTTGARLDAERGYPTDFVREMTEAGFLTAY